MGDGQRLVQWLQQHGLPSVSYDASPERWDILARNIYALPQTTQQDALTRLAASLNPQHAGTTGSITAGQSPPQASPNGGIVSAAVQAMQQATDQTPAQQAQQPGSIYNPRLSANDWQYLASLLGITPQQAQQMVQGIRDNYVIASVSRATGYTNGVWTTQAPGGPQPSVSGLLNATRTGLGSNELQLQSNRTGIRGSRVDNEFVPHQQTNEFGADYMPSERQVLTALESSVDNLATMFVGLYAQKYLSDFGREMPGDLRAQLVNQLKGEMAQSPTLRDTLQTQVIGTVYASEQQQFGASALNVPGVQASQAAGAGLTGGIGASGVQTLDVGGITLPKSLTDTVSVYNQTHPLQADQDQRVIGAFGPLGRPPTSDELTRLRNADTTTIEAYIDQQKLANGLTYGAWSKLYPVIQSDWEKYFGSGKPLTDQDALHLAGMDDTQRTDWFMQQPSHLPGMNIGTYQAYDAMSHRAIDGNPEMSDVLAAYQAGNKQ